MSLKLEHGTSRGLPGHWASPCRNLFAWSAMTRVHLNVSIGGESPVDGTNFVSD